MTAPSVRYPSFFEPSAGRSCTYAFSPTTPRRGPSFGGAANTAAVPPAAGTAGSLRASDEPGASLPRQAGRRVSASGERRAYGRTEERRRFSHTTLAAHHFAAAGPPRAQGGGGVATAASGEKGVTTGSVSIVFTHAHSGSRAIAGALVACAVAHAARGSASAHPAHQGRPWKEPRPLPIARY